MKRNKFFVLSFDDLFASLVLFSPLITNAGDNDFLCWLIFLLSFGGFISLWECWFGLLNGLHFFVRLLNNLFLNWAIPLAKIDYRVLPCLILALQPSVLIFQVEIPSALFGQLPVAGLQFVLQSLPLIEKMASHRLILPLNYSFLV